MGFARTSIKGVTIYDSRKAYRGLTIYTPVEGNEVLLIDMRGNIVNKWKMKYKAGYNGELLPNGRLLYTGKIDNGPLKDLEGAGGIIIEVDWNGKVLWEYRDKNLHHGFYRMKNGNTLVHEWVRMPEEIVMEIKPDYTMDTNNQVIWSEAIQEITPNGKVIWEWIAHEHKELIKSYRCLLCPYDTWLHANGCSELPSGNILVSFAKINTVAIIDKKSKDIKWSWGSPGELAHQHSPSMLESGNILIFDNGYHPFGMAQNYSRVLEIDPKSNKMVWSYEGPMDGDMKMYFYSSIYSNCQRLPNGNTLICEGTSGRIFEITKDGEIIWEYVHYLDQKDKIGSRSFPVYSAYRYGMDYSGLKNKIEN